MRLGDINLSPFDTYVLNLINRATELAGHNNWWLRGFGQIMAREQTLDGKMNLINILRSQMVRLYGDAGRTDPYEGGFQMRPRKTKKSARKSARKSTRKTKKSAKKTKKSAKKSASNTESKKEKTKKKSKSKKSDDWDAKKMGF